MVVAVEKQKAETSRKSSKGSKSQRNSEDQNSNVPKKQPGPPPKVDQNA